MKSNFFKKGKTNLILFTFLLFFSFSFVLVSALDVTEDTNLNSITGVNIQIPETPINYSLVPTVNSSDFWDSLDTPADITDFLRLDQSNFGFADDWISYSNPNFDFNDLKFNDSVKILFAEEQVIYNATMIETVTGTLDSGNLASITQLNDGDTYNVSEVTGTPGFLININFTDVVNFNTVALRGRYEGGAGHTVAIELYRVGVDWEERAEITDQTDFGVTTFDVFIGSNFIDEHGTVRLRLNHDDNGISNHDYFLDAVFIGQVTGLVSGGDLSDLTGRDNACELLPDVLCKDGTKELTGQWNYGNQNINGTGDFTTTGNITADTYFGDGSKLTNTPSDNETYDTHITSDGTDHSFINQDIKTTANPTFNTVKITSGESFGLILDADTSEYSGDKTLIIDVPTTGKTLTVNDNVVLNFGTPQSTATTASPTFIEPTINNLTFDMTNDYKIMDRAGGLAWVNLQSGTGMIFEQFSMDGDATDSVTHNIFARGSPLASMANLELLQMGYNVATPDYRFWSVQTGSGAKRAINIFTGGNTNQLKLNVDGGIVLATTYNDDIGTQRDLLINSSGHLGYDSSSVRFKENIKNITDLESKKIYDLRPVIYDKINGSKNQIGLIAEEVNELYPQFVSYKRDEIWGICEGETIGDYDCIKEYRLSINKTTGKYIPETISYKMLVTPLIAEVQELNERLKYLEDNCVLK